MAAAWKQTTEHSEQERGVSKAGNKDEEASW